ncbi:glycosyl hydrolase 53 family protein [Neobacillus sp. YIM B02564]|uniref:Arabinogalactan endo-beta-1,4-galactanase n=1 Tax=Neobacillus paridis TaxID=2803862 RepID=A0ABS1TPM3_9BACI|nr:glycosyl hydrolase 53 family protein [Neobacillus paridis]MBL4953255.1 glycosyl hydrolase 53 family protein [Neobacillus paridis]
MNKITKSFLVAGSTLALLTGSFAPSLAVPLAYADTVSSAYSNGTDTGAAKLPAAINKVSTVTEDTIRGVDLTPYQAELAAGVKYKDFNGQTLDENGFMNLLKESGINYINLKVAVNPKNDSGASYGGGNPTLDNAIKTAKAAKAAGLKVNINFLFSDFYTFKDNQKLPKNWSTDNLKQTAVQYIHNALNELKGNNVTPEIITIGSNMAQNFLNQDLATGNEILAAVTHEIRTINSSSKIALGNAGSGSGWFTTIANNLKSAHVDYDILGANVYAAWDKMSDIQGAKEAANNAGKKFAILSVSYPFTDQDSDGQSNGSTAGDIVSQGIGAVSPQGQATYLRKLYSAITTDGNNTADAGVFYDNAVWIAVEAGNSGAHWQANKAAAEQYGTGWATTAAAGYVDGADQWAGASSVDNQALFDDLGNPLQSLTTFKQLLSGTEDNNDSSETNNDIPQADPYQTGADTGLKDQSVTIKKISTMSPDTIRGVDISSYEALKQAGVKYYDYEGKEQSLLKILHDNGVNYIRLRIWNDPKNADGAIYGGGQSDVEHELKIAEEAAKYGIKVLLDFHYSDFWADPAQQILPKAWQGHSDSQLQQDVYNFTSDTIKKFQAVGADVGMVQVGNEITNGMMGVTTNRDKGESYAGVWNDKIKSARVNGYLKAGVKAVRDMAPNALVTLHIETPNVKKYTDIMNAWKRDGVDYDVLGSSYYPYWSVTAKSNTPDTLTKVEKLAASYGKLFAVMETAWTNSLKDSDGTPNSIGEEQSDWQNTNAFPVGSQGQVDAMTSLYSTMMSQSNGLGAFYWEPAWIPVHPGWTNWKANKEIAEKFGTGWASSGAVGYFPDSKLYWNGQPAWGGSSWDNQTLFDNHGYALQSLKFYKDSIGESSTQTTVFKYVDAKTGKSITTNTIVRGTVGQTMKVTLPAVKYYIPSSKSYTYTLKPNTEGVKTITVKYDSNPQGNAVKYGKYVTVTNKNYTVWKNFSWEKKNATAVNKTYLAKYVYNHSNGSKYFSLYDDKGKWVGYINAKAVKAGNGKQGYPLKYGKYVTVKSKHYNVFQSFSWKKKNVKVINKTYLAKYVYYHSNGSKYLSLYDGKGKWIGYINAKAITNKR